MKETAILLIDHKFDDIKAFVNIFEGEASSVLVAVSLEKAKAVMSYVVPDLIVTELKLEDGSGYEILRFIRKFEEFSNVPFVFLSDDSDPKQKVKALSHGVEDYFTKPFIPLELKIRLLRILRRHHKKRFDIDKKIFSSTNNLSIIEFIQFIERAQKSGTLTLFVDHKVGVYDFQNGNIIRGKFGSSTGEDALFRLFGTKSGVFEFEFKRMECEPQIKEATQAILLRWLTLVDESKIEEIPEPEAHEKYEVFCAGYKKENIKNFFDENVYNIVAFENPNHLLDILEKVAPDLIVTSPHAPYINGFKLLNILNENPATHHIPVVFLTNETSEDDKIIALKEGVAEFFMPPIIKYEFDTKVKKIIQESALKKQQYSSNVLRGSLINFTILEVIQGLQAIEKTCKVTFYNGDDSCSLFFENGSIVNVRLKHSEGEEAVHKILTWSRGYFEIVFKDYDVPKQIKTATFHIILDGITQSIERDTAELKRATKGVPEEGEGVSSTLNVGLYGFLVEMAKFDYGMEVSFSTIKHRRLSRFMQLHDAKSTMLLVDLNIVQKDTLDELIELKKALYENVQNGMNIICFTSRPEIYDVNGVINKFSWLISYDGTKEIKESLSDKLTINTTVDFFEFNEIKKSMYYTAAFPHGFGSPAYKPLLFSDDGIPVALYRNFGDGNVFLMPQPQSKEDFISFFIENIIPKINERE